MNITKKLEAWFSAAPPKADCPSAEEVSVTEADRTRAAIDAMVKARIGDKKWIYLDAVPLGRLANNESIPIKLEGVAGKFYVKTHNGFPVDIAKQNAPKGNKEEEAKTKVNAETSFFIAQFLSVNRTKLLEAAIQGKKEDHESFSYPADGIPEDERETAARTIAKELGFIGGRCRRGKFIFALKAEALEAKETPKKARNREIPKHSENILNKIALNYLSENKEMLTALFMDTLMADKTEFSYKPRIEKDALFALSRFLKAENDFIREVTVNGRSVNIYFNKKMLADIQSGKDLGNDKLNDPAYDEDEDEFTKISPEEGR